MPKTIKFSLSLPKSVYESLEAEAATKSRDEQDFMRWILIEHAIQSGFLNKKEQDILSLYRDICDRVANKAIELNDTEGFSPDVTLRAIRECQSDSQWLADYRRYIEDDNEFAEKNPRKASLNQNIGYRVKRALEAELDLGAKGKKIVVKVNGELIKSYSRLKKGIQK